MERIFKDFIEVDNIPTGAYPFAPKYRRIGVLSVGRQVFYSPKRIYSDVNIRYYQLRAEGRDIKKVVFLSRGEPTLDANLGRVAKMLKAAGFRLEILTSGGMLWREDVREDLKLFERAVVEIAAVRKGVWEEIMRPHPFLTYERVFEGIRAFAREYPGTLDFLFRSVDGVDLKEEKKALESLAKEVGANGIFTI